MRTILILLGLVCLIEHANSQSCPTFSSRNNGNGGGNCSSLDADRYGSYSSKTGHFRFSGATSYTVNDVYFNNVLIQQGNTVLSGSIYFGEINAGANSADLCFYTNGNSNTVPPAGQFKFTLTTGSTNLTCSYNITSNTSGSLSSISPGTIGTDQTICSGKTASLTSVSNASGTSTYKWQQSTTSASSGFTDIASSNSSTLTTPVLTQTTYFQRIAIDGVDEYASNVITVTVSPELTWVGSSSNAFGTTANWNPALDPAGCNVTIPTVSSPNNYPTVSSTASVKSLTVNSGSQLTINASTTFTLTENFTNNGKIYGDGNLNFQGSASQSVSGTGWVGNVTVNNSAGVSIASTSDTLNIFGTLTLTNGTVTTNGNLVLKASSTQEGTIGTVSNCPRTPFSGEIIVERFVPGYQRSFRLLTPGVTSTTTINANWQEGGSGTTALGYPYSSAPQNPKPGYGTHITGSTTGQNGLDATVTGNPSMYEYVASSQLWSTISNTTDPSNLFKVGEGYQILIRGSRATDMKTNTPTPDSTIIRTKGTPAVCTFTFNTGTTVPLSNSATGFSFIGNPYWSIVNWNSVSKTGIENNYYYYDPTLPGLNNRGAYVTLSLGSSDINDINSAGASSKASRYLQPGQGFFVKNTSTTPEIVFNESDKVVDITKKKGIFAKSPVDAGSEFSDLDQSRVRGSTINEKIFISLFLKKNISIGPADGSALVYGATYSDQIAGEDATKFTNPDENLAFLKEARRFSILGMRATNDPKSDTIPITMWNLSNQEYVLRVNLQDYIIPSREIFLINKTTGVVNKLTNNTIYDQSFTPAVGVRTNDEYAIVFNTAPIKPKTRIRKTLVLTPNPVTNGILQIQVPSEILNTLTTKSASLIEIVNQRGMILLTSSVNINSDGRISQNIEDLPPGIYTLRSTVNGVAYINKFIKE